MPDHPSADRSWADLSSTRTVVLVEGRSDENAVRTLARRLGRDLAADGVEVVAMGGATNVGRALEHYGPRGLGRHVLGLCDAGEVRVFLRGLERAGFGAPADRAGMEALGFHVCDLDLEDELVRALGVDRVEEVIAADGIGRSWRTLQRQPFHRGRAPAQQLRRFIGTTSGRKVRYGALLAEALDLERVPPPLAKLLAQLGR